MSDGLTGDSTYIEVFTTPSSRRGWGNADLARGNIPSGSPDASTLSIRRERVCDHLTVFFGWAVHNVRPPFQKLLPVDAVRQRLCLNAHAAVLLVWALVLAREAPIQVARGVPT
jgi:hypothetical protein